MDHDSMFIRSGILYTEYILRTRVPSYTHTETKEIPTNFRGTRCSFEKKIIKSCLESCFLSSFRKHRFTKDVAGVMTGEKTGKRIPHALRMPNLGPIFHGRRTHAALSNSRSAATKLLPSCAEKLIDVLLENWDPGNPTVPERVKQSRFCWLDLASLGCDGL